MRNCRHRGGLSQNCAEVRHESDAAGTVPAEAVTIRYRYRTSALAGRWRDSREAALRDAVKANQAELDDSAPDGARWLVQGEIEEEGASALLERIRRH